MTVVFKLVLIGDSNVGKTSIFDSYINHEFPTSHRPTLGVEFGFRQFKGPEGTSTVKLQLWDTAGHERFKSITRSYYRGASMLALVYDITKRESFVSLRDWVADIKESIGVIPSCVLIGNKVDKANKGQRQVTPEEVAEFAAKLGCSNNPVEVSAKTGEGIERLFESLITDMVCPVSMKPLEIESSAIIHLVPQSTQTPSRRFCPCA
jgi:small GTP-binding protein